MPRTLPWAQKPSSSTTRGAVAAKPPTKRVKLSSEPSNSPAQSSKNQDRAPSTSPPPDAPPEKFMHDGMGGDDRYRMVEDEFLSIAQSFTVHLHTAEYARQEKMVKSRKADTISSISRPVTGQMPAETRRRLEGVDREVRLQSIAKNLGKEKAKVEDEESEGELPYFGTTLHGLMDSPRRKGRMLMSAKGLTKATIAKTVSTGAQVLKREESPKSKVQMKIDQRATIVIDSATESSEDNSDDDGDDDEEDEDDLDAPIKYSRR